MGASYLVAGLGNPGKEYENTRHNIGFMTVDKLARDYGVKISAKKFNALFSDIRIGTKSVILAKPQTFMNKSGNAIRNIRDYYKIQSRDIIVVHDDIDLAMGQIKIKQKGGHGGHNGIRSIMEVLGGGEFIRLRIGIGRSESGNNVTNHVLGEFTNKEKEFLPEIIVTARDAIVSILCKGAEVSMNDFNNHRSVITS